MNSQLDTDHAVEILCNMISRPTVNPMGQPRKDANAPEGIPVERPVIEYLESVFSPYGIPMQRQRCNDDHENLLITVAGSSSAGASLFESHIDTVPADDWPDGAFEPRVENGLVFGRGACDDKGPLTAMVVALLDFLKSGQKPPQTIYLLAAADEESGQSGIKHFANTFAENVGGEIGRGVFGEPTSCLPIIQHKGVVRWDIVTHGKSCHSSQPENGVDAIWNMMEVMKVLRQVEEELSAEYSSEMLTPPTLTVTMIEGGRTRNALADECKVAVDFRIAPGMTCDTAYERVVEATSQLGFDVTNEKPQTQLRPLNTEADSALVQTTVDVCSNVLKQGVAPGAATYGTDACWIPGNAPALVLGPGDIAVAHTNHEHVPIDDLLNCSAIYRSLMLHDWGK